jgi:phosphatidylserine/phosphatidylglycerophosphate/cardiolipin synthase-like enzyme
MPLLAFAVFGWFVIVLNPPRQTNRRPPGPRYETLLDMDEQIMKARMPIQIATILAFAAAGAAQADPLTVETHYAPTENLEKIDVAQLTAAREKIDMAAYVLTDVAVIEALTAAAGRGVKIRVYRDSSGPEPFGRPKEALGKLNESRNVEIRFKADDHTLMHLKSYCIDERTLRTGGANFSASGLKQQDNDLILLRGPGVCDRFDTNFKTIWGAP